MNFLWGGMLLIGILYGSLTGNLKEVTEAVISSSKEAVTLCVTAVSYTHLDVYKRQSLELRRPERF